MLCGDSQCDSGSLQIRGGISIIGNTYIGGNLITYKDNIFNGNVKINSLFINDGGIIYFTYYILPIATHSIGRHVDIRVYVHH